MLFIFTSIYYPELAQLVVQSYIEASKMLGVINMRLAFIFGYSKLFYLYMCIGSQ